MPKPIFTTPQQAEEAFYEALEKADLEAMMAVWSDDDEVVCVHPGGPRLAGYATVRESWRQIFSGAQRLRVVTSQPVVIQGMLVAVHSLHESITVVGEEQYSAMTVTTNVYVRGALGWRMLVHHASPGQASAEMPGGDAPKTVH